MLQLASLPTLAASTVGAALSIVAQTIPSSGTDVQSLATQLGIFGVVIAVFKYMLSRQDSRDADQEKRDQEMLVYLRTELATEKAARVTDRTESLEAAERAETRHEGTRARLYELQTQIIQLKKDAS